MVILTRQMKYANVRLLSLITMEYFKNATILVRIAMVILFLIV